MTSAATLDLIKDFTTIDNPRRNAYLQAIRPKLQELQVDDTKLDDETLIRFGIARSGDVHASSVMLKAYTQWRSDFVDKLPNDAFPPTLYPVRGFKCCPDSNLEPKQFPENWKKWLKHHGGGSWHKTSKLGHPIVFENIGKHDAKGFAKDCPREELLEWHVRVNEYLFGPLMKECSEKCGKPIDKILVVFDMTGTGLHQLNPSGLQVLKSIVDCDQQYFPERLHQLFIINAPSLFTMGWKIISTWLDPRVLEKIHILGSSYQSTLLQYIDAENLPKVMGGTCVCNMPGGCVPPIEVAKK